MDLLVIIVIAISLSMDAFSLSLAYGTLELNKNDVLKLFFIVGIFHFFMPLIGFLVGKQVFNILPVSSNFIVFVILSIIGIEMIIESFKEKETKKLMNIFQLFLFGLAVSIDSFSVGIGIKGISEKYYLCSLIFSISSFIFTYLGLILGKKLSQMLGKVSTIIGGIVLIVIGLIYLV